MFATESAPPPSVPAPRSSVFLLTDVPFAGPVAANDGRDNCVGYASQQDVRASIGETLPALHRRARYLARSRADADDLVADTVERALRFASSFQLGTNLRAWLMQIMYTVFASRCRRARREKVAQTLLSDEPNGWTQASTEAPDSRTVLKGLVDKLKTLPEPYAEVLWLVDYHEYPYSEAASLLGVPLGTVMSRLHRARRLMRTALDPQVALG